MIRRLRAWWRTRHYSMISDIGTTRERMNEIIGGRREL